MKGKSGHAIPHIRENEFNGGSALDRRSLVFGTAALGVVMSLTAAAPSAASSRANTPSLDLEGITPPDTQANRLIDLVTANRILADQEVNDGFGHVSVRSFDNPERYFLSRSRAPELVTADDIIEYDLESRPVIAKDQKMYEERYIHGEIYKRRADVNCIIHSHTSAVLPFGVTSKALRPIMHMAAFLPPEVPVFEIRDVDGPDNHILVTHPQSGEALAVKLGEGPVVLMRGHGMTVVGPNVRQAVYRAIYTKKAAEIELQSLALGGEVKYLSEKESVNFAKRLARMGDADYQPLRPWPIWEARANARIRQMLGAAP